MNSHNIASRRCSFPISDQMYECCLDAEKAVVGAILLESRSLVEVESILTSGDFKDHTCRTVFDVVKKLSDGGHGIDLVSVAMHPDMKTKDIKRGDIVGLTQMVGSAAHVSDHARMVKEFSIRCQLYELGLKIESMATSETDACDVIDFAAERLDSVIRGISQGKGARPISEIAGRALTELENRIRLYRSGKTTGITTGIEELDKACGGWKPGQLLILAARPAMGKTALMLHFAKRAAESGVPVCIYSLEMQDTSLYDRLVIAESGVDAYRFRSGRLTCEELEQVEKAAGRLNDLPIYIDDRGAVSMRYIRTQAQNMKRQGQCGMILCDYLQLADVSSSERGRSREQEITQATIMAKATAKALDVPFMLLSQLSRAVEQRGDKVPQLSDLRESGSIEQDADMVMFIHRPAYYGASTIELNGETIPAEGIGNLIIAKQRDGMTGTVTFSHNSSLTVIRDYNKGDNPRTADSPF